MPLVFFSTSVRAIITWWPQPVHFRRKSAPTRSTSHSSPTIPTLSLQRRHRRGRTTPSLSPLSPRAPSLGPNLHRGQATPVAPLLPRRRRFLVGPPHRRRPVLNLPLDLAPTSLAAPCIDAACEAPL